MATAAFLLGCLASLTADSVIDWVRPPVKPSLEFVAEDQFHNRPETWFGGPGMWLRNPNNQPVQLVSATINQMPVWVTTQQGGRISAHDTQWVPLVMDYSYPCHQVGPVQIRFRLGGQEQVHEVTLDTSLTSMLTAQTCPSRLSAVTVQSIGTGDAGRFRLTIRYSRPDISPPTAINLGEAMVTWSTDLVPMEVQLDGQTATLHFGLPAPSCDADFGPDPRLLLELDLTVLPTPSDPVHSETDRFEVRLIDQWLTRLEELQRARC